MPYALAELPRLLKGYGETQARNSAIATRSFPRWSRPRFASGDFFASGTCAAISAALADPEHVALDAALKQAAE